MRSEKFALTIVVLVWFAGLAVLSSARQVYAHDYVHRLPEDAATLSWSARNIAIPILAADVIEGLSSSMFWGYWGFIWITPILVITWMWRANDRTDVLMRWVVGMSIYAAAVAVSVGLTIVALWLPLRS